MGRKYIDYTYPFRKATNRITSCPLGSSPQKARHRFAVQSPLLSKSHTMPLVGASPMLHASIPFFEDIWQTTVNNRK
jgi:hypothetical protein